MYLFPQDRLPISFHYSRYINLGYSRHSLEKLGDWFVALTVYTFKFYRGNLALTVYIFLFIAYYWHDVCFSSLQNNQGEK